MTGASVAKLFRRWSKLVIAADKASQDVRKAVREILADVIGPEGERGGYWVHYAGEGDCLSEIVLYGFGQRALPHPSHILPSPSDELAGGYTYSARTILEGLTQAANQSIPTADDEFIYYAPSFSAGEDEDIGLNLDEFIHLSRRLYPAYKLLGDGLSFFWTSFAEGILKGNGITDWYPLADVTGEKPVFTLAPIASLNGVHTPHQKAMGLLHKALALFGQGEGRVK